MVFRFVYLRTLRPAGFVVLASPAHFVRSAYHIYLFNQSFHSFFIGSLGIAALSSTLCVLNHPIHFVHRMLKQPPSPPSQLPWLRLL